MSEHMKSSHCDFACPWFSVVTEKHYCLTEPTNLLQRVLGQP